MRTVLAFDVYGTLIDTAGIVAKLRSLVGGEADTFARIWREKQLEYSFRRGLMRRYAPFPVCIAGALAYTCDHLGIALAADDRDALLSAYRTLPAFDDVAAGLSLLPGDDFALYAFSNGTAEAVESLLVNAGIDGFFADIVSVDEIGSFKPDPTVYRHFLKRAGTTPEDAWLISGNPFDVIGAIAVGMRGAWIRRSAGMIFDPWDIEPTITLAGLNSLGPEIAACRAAASKP
jgi:2-haloacid dehalogenase